jgi:hypothetical protein
MEEKQAADLLWNEWKYRHDLFWKMLFRWGASVLTLWAIPFLRPVVFKPLPRLALLFPLMAFVLSLFSAWLLAAEQRRFGMVNQMYNELRGRFLPPRMPQETRMGKLLAAPIGATIVYIYGLGLGLLSLVVGWALWLSLK